MRFLAARARWPFVLLALGGCIALTPQVGPWLVGRLDIGSQAWSAVAAVASALFSLALLFATFRQTRLAREAITKSAENSAAALSKARDANKITRRAFQIASRPRLRLSKVTARREPRIGDAALLTFYLRNDGGGQVATDVSVAGSAYVVLTLDESEAKKAFNEKCDFGGEIKPRATDRQIQPHGEIPYIAFVDKWKPWRGQHVSTHAFICYRDESPSERGAWVLVHAVASLIVGQDNTAESGEAEIRRRDEIDSNALRLTWKRQYGLR